MFRNIIGRFIEWCLNYNRIVIFEGGIKPFNKHKGDAGYDLYINEDVIIKPKSSIDIHTGIHIQSRYNIWFEIKGRSSTLNKYGIIVTDAVIDSGYRGELYLQVFNSTDKYINLNNGQRIAQIVPHLILPIKFIAGKIKCSDRGINGFGSTGI